MKHITSYLLMVVFVLMTGSAWAGSVTIPNTFTSGTKARAAAVNDNFSAIKSAVDDNDTRINTLISQSQTPPYKYHYDRPQWILINRVDGYSLGIVGCEFNQQVSYTTRTGGGLSIDAVQTPVVKLTAIDGPGISNLAFAAINRAQIQTLSLDLHGITIQMNNVVVSSITKIGKEFALPGKYVTNSTDPELVFIVLTWAGQNTSVTITDITNQSTTYNIDTNQVTGCSFSRDINYVDLGGGSSRGISLPANSFVLYRYNLAFLNDFSGGLSGSANFAPIIADSPGDETPAACLYGAFAHSQQFTLLNIAYLDSAGQVQPHHGVTANNIVPISYMLFGGDDGHPVLSMSYYYDEITIQDDANTSMCWDVVNNRGC